MMDMNIDASSSVIGPLSKASLDDVRWIRFAFAQAMLQPNENTIKLAVI